MIHKKVERLKDLYAYRAEVAQQPVSVNREMELLTVSVEVNNVEADVNHYILTNVQFHLGHWIKTECAPFCVIRYSDGKRRQSNVTIHPTDPVQTFWNAKRQAVEMTRWAIGLDPT